VEKYVEMLENMKNEIGKRFYGLQDMGSHEPCRNPACAGMTLWSYFNHSCDCKYDVLQGGDNHFTQAHVPHFGAEAR
jgi:hypothetical protein